jgi:hypothetical protein
MDTRGIKGLPPENCGFNSSAYHDPDAGIRKWALRRNLKAPSLIGSPWRVVPGFADNGSFKLT